MVMIASLIVGSFVAAYASGDFRIRKPKLNRVPNYAIGGLLMGVGSRLAAGCNIANLFSGIALLSVHSFIAGAGDHPRRLRDDPLHVPRGRLRDLNRTRDRVQIRRLRR